MTVVTLSIIILSVIMPNVVAPGSYSQELLRSFLDEEFYHSGDQIISS
jgi:hypothetical protein